MTKVKLLLSEAVTVYNELKTSAGKATIDLAWAIDDIVEALSTFQKRYIEKRNELLIKWGEPKGPMINGNQRYSFKPEKLELYNKEMETLSEVEVEVEIERIDFDVLLDQEIKFSPAAAKLIRKFVVKQEAPKAEEAPKPVVKRRAVEMKKSLSPPKEEDKPAS